MIIQYSNKIANYFLADSSLSNNKKLGTLPGITNWNEWTWPDEKGEQGFIYVRPLPGIGVWMKFSPKKIGNIIKNYSIQKPDPKISERTHPDKPWTMPFVEHKSIYI